MRALIAVVFALVLIGGLIYWVAAKPADPLPGARLDHTRPRPQGGSYTIAVAEPATLNPFTTVGAVARSTVLRYTHDTLMELDPKDGSLRPALATHVEVGNAGRRLIFTIRPDATFSDGRPVELDDVLFTHALGRATTLPLGAVNKALHLIESARALDDQRIEFRLREATFTSCATLATHYVVADKAWFMGEISRRAQRLPTPRISDANFGPLLAAITEPGPGSGPYQLARWQPGRRLDLQQNPHSWRRQTHPTSYNLERLSLRFISDRTAQLTLLRQGAIDLYQTAEAAALLEDDAQLRRECRALSYSHLGLGHFVVLFNHRRPPFGDARIRRGISMLFDRETIAAKLLSGKATPSHTWFRPGSREEKDAGPALPFDPSAARTLFEAAGQPQLRFELLFAASQTNQRRIVELAQGAFQRARATLDARGMEWSALEARLRAEDFDGILLHMSLPPAVDPYLVFHSAQIEGGNNFMGYADPAVDDLLLRARAELDDDRRLQLFARFNASFLRDQPLAVLVHPQSSVLLRKKFHGVEVGALGLHPELWWVPEPDK